MNSNRILRLRVVSNLFSAIPCARIDSNEKTPSGCLERGVKGFIASMKRTPWRSVLKNECNESSEVLERARWRYGRRGKVGRSRLWDEICALCGYERKYASTVLRGTIAAPWEARNLEAETLRREGIESPRAYHLALLCPCTGASAAEPSTTVIVELAATERTLSMIPLGHSTTTVALVTLPIPKCSSSLPCEVYSPPPPPLCC